MGLDIACQRRQRQSSFQRHATGTTEKLTRSVEWGTIFDKRRVPEAKDAEGYRGYLVRVCL